MTTKVDLKRELPCYSATRAPAVVEVPELRYLMIDGHGDPNTSVRDDALAALYPIAYALKFASKRAGRDYVVMPLEGLWWADDLDSFTLARDKSRWDWTLMVLVPDWTTDDDIADAVAQVRRKGAPARLDDVRTETLAEGRCVQALHIGSYDDEAALLRHIHHEFVPGQGLALAGKHHEIYLGDPRKADPAKLRTILRQPVVPL